jgi:N utilization substance protein A
VPGDNMDLLGAITELERERGIDRETLLQAVEAALVSAYKRNYDTVENVAARINRATGRVELFVIKRVVDQVVDPTQEIALDEAVRIDPAYQAGDVVEFPVVLKNFGRIAAQTAKQVVVQRIREAERGMVYDEFVQREGDIVSGVVQRVQNRNVYVDLGRTEAVLPPSEQMSGDAYAPGERLKCLLVEVRRTPKGPQVILSRAHRDLLKRLFELEVPEIHDGLVEVRAIAREAGTRSKMAVYARDDHVDPVGACVGHKGMRVQQVVNELRGERVDIVKWAPSPAEFVANALSPSKVSHVLLNEEEKVARVVVPDFYLSLAIGRAGQNARLAAKLTGWRIDIRSESQLTDAERAEIEAQPPLGLRVAPWQAALDGGGAGAPVAAPWTAATPVAPWQGAADGAGSWPAAEEAPPAGEHGGGAPRWPDED